MHTFCNFRPYVAVLHADTFVDDKNQGTFQGTYQGTYGSLQPSLPLMGCFCFSEGGCAVCLYRFVFSFPYVTPFLFLLFCFVLFCFVLFSCCPNENNDGVSFVACWLDCCGVVCIVVGTVSVVVPTNKRSLCHH